MKTGGEFMQRMWIALAALCLSINAMAGELDFDQLKGKVVYVDFWASWCGPCRSSFPWMEDMHKKYAVQGLEIVAINLDQEPELAQKFLQEYPATFRIEYDSEGEIAEQFKVETMPTSFLIDRSGKARIKHKGFHANKVQGYEQEIQQLLGES